MTTPQPMTADRIRAAFLAELATIAPDIDTDALDPAVDLREQADLDSMDFLNLTIALNQRLRIDIPESDTAALTTIDGAVAFIARQLGG
ncbi:MAG: acyl carrier protein [Alphaproteobacteria bacterium]